MTDRHRLSDTDLAEIERLARLNAGAYRCGGGAAVRLAALVLFVLVALLGCKSKCEQAAEKFCQIAAEQKAGKGESAFYSVVLERMKPEIDLCIARETLTCEGCGSQ